MADLSLFAYHPFVILGGVYEIPNNDDKNKVTDSDLEETSRRVRIVNNP
jgi:NagD protein